MKNLTNLFKLIELTRSQVQQGYLLSGIKRNDLSNLAEHHYLVTFIAWQLVLHLQKLGAKIDIQKVLEFALIHDLGELFGGDISAHYAKLNPRARKFAKAFELENQKFLAKYFGFGAKNFKKLGKEILNAKSNEALIVKVADYMEALSFRYFLRELPKQAMGLTGSKIFGFIRKIKDPIAKKELTQFVTVWLKELPKAGEIEKIFAQEL